MQVFAKNDPVNTYNMYWILLGSNGDWMSDKSKMNHMMKV